MRCKVLVVAVLLSEATPAFAGMPSVTLTDITRMRVESISFFSACFLLSAWAVQRIWNGLRGDFPRLPRISYGRAVGVVSLWGLLFLLVLTMISGARELLTPGAWRKEGFTYKLDEPKPDTSPDKARDSARRQALESLRLALWAFAPNHAGRFPKDDKVPDIPDPLWRVPDPSGLRYLYVGGQSADKGEAPLAYEPGIFGKDRFVLLTNGEIVRMTPAEIHQALQRGGEH